MIPGPRVGVDVRMWNHTGIGRYIRELWQRLPNLGIDLVPFGPASILSGLDRRGVELDAPLHSLREQLALTWAIRGKALDLFHAPHVTAPLASSVPMVATIHDLIPLHVPVLGPAGKAYFKLMGTRFVPAKARHLLTVSGFTRDDLISRGVAADHITVTPLGVDATFGISEPESRRKALRERLGLAGPYLLHVGQWKPHKNVGILLQAMAGLVAEGRWLPPLVLLGKPDPRHDLRPLAERLGLSDLLRVIPGLPDEGDVRALYQEATAFLFPSRIEGFGLPPLEAMAAGLPVIASTTSAMAETLAGACLEASWDDVVAWKEALRAVLSDESLRRHLSDQGRARARSYTWDFTARLTAEVYRRAAGAPAP